jgi:hypothetical protein
MIVIAIVGLLVGGMCGMLTMSLFAVNAYDKGFEDGKASNLD